jgi:hypothetical protein
MHKIEDAVDSKGFKISAHLVSYLESSPGPHICLKDASSLLGTRQEGARRSRVSVP